jgi:exopolysaccharide biosynthesis protein
LSSIRAASTLGESGELAGKIARDNGGVLAMTANGFDDKDKDGNDGKGNGGVIAGFSMCNGVPIGKHLSPGFKRVELRDDDRMYIVDVRAPVAENCTDAAEFTPALIVDGKVLVDENCGWNAINPRACIGQNSRGEIMMLVIEGRLVTSLGIGVVKCAEMMKQYDCMQALNLDGGTSAIMWYRGKYVTRCSNTDLPYGRTLPNAFIYEGTM